MIRLFTIALVVGFLFGGGAAIAGSEYECDYYEYSCETTDTHDHTSNSSQLRSDARNWAAMAAAMDFVGFPLGKRFVATGNFANIDLRSAGALGGTLGYEITPHWAGFVGGAVGVSSGDGAVKVGFRYAR